MLANTSLSCSNISHLGDTRRILDVNDFKALIVVSISGMVMMTLNVVEAVGTVCSRHWYHLGEVGEVYSVPALFTSGNDGQEVVAPHDFLRNKGGPDLAGRAGGLGCAIQEDDQLKILLVECVHCHLKEGTAFVNDVVQGKGTHKEEVVLPSIDHEVNVHLVHNNCVAIWCVRCSQHLAINLAANHQGFPQVSHSYRQTKCAVFRANDSHVSKCDGLGSVLR